MSTIVVNPDQVLEEAQRDFLTKVCLFFFGQDSLYFQFTFRFSCRTQYCVQVFLTWKDTSCSKICMYSHPSEMIPCLVDDVSWWRNRLAIGQHSLVSMSSLLYASESTWAMAFSTRASWFWCLYVTSRLTVIFWIMSCHVFALAEPFVGISSWCDLAEGSRTF